MSARVIDSLEELKSLVGQDLGTSDWLTVDQARVDTFADATDDHQWIHVDEERAASGPYGGTIAHGFLTLSLIPKFAAQIFTTPFGGARLNYGLERVRFPSPVKVGARVRATAQLVEVAETPKGVRTTTKYTVEIEGHDRPACVTEHLVLITG